MTIYRDDIQKVYDLLEKPERWTRGCEARDANGNATWAQSPAAVSWCLMGAKIKLFGWGYDCGFAASQLIEEVGVSGVTEFNDAPGRKHAEVLELLRSAIERAPVRPS